VALRIAATVFVLGALAMWLVAPVGNPCPDLGKLPPGSTSASKASFSPPLTRTCTYRTPDGTQAQARYTPWVWWLALALIAGLAAAAVHYAAPGAPRPERAPRPAPAPRPEPPPRPEPAPRSEPAPPPAAGPGPRDDAERERARLERAERARRRRED
jgi:hypothetical protein